MAQNGVDAFQRLNAPAQLYVNDHHPTLHLLAILEGIIEAPSAIVAWDSVGVWILMVWNSLGLEHVAASQIAVNSNCVNW